MYGFKSSKRAFHSVQRSATTITVKETIWAPCTLLFLVNFCDHIPKTDTLTPLNFKTDVHQTQKPPTLVKIYRETSKYRENIRSANRNTLHLVTTSNHILLVQCGECAFKHCRHHKQLRQLVKYPVVINYPWGLMVSGWHSVQCIHLQLVLVGVWQSLTRPGGGINLRSHCRLVW